MTSVIILALISASLCALLVKQKCETPFRADIERLHYERELSGEEVKENKALSFVGHIAGFITPLSRKSEKALRAQLERANLSLTPTLWQGIVLIAMLGSAFLSLTIALTFKADILICILVTLAFPVLAWFVTREYLKQKIKSYRVAVEHSLPNAIEMLSISVTAGLTLQEGIKTVAHHKESIGMAAQEFYRCSQEIDYAGVSFTEALQHMRERMESSTVSSFVNALILGAQGAGVKKTLQIQAQESRAILRDEIKEEIAKMGVKMTIPMTLFFLPTVLIFVLVPTVIQIIGFLSGM